MLLVWEGKKVERVAEVGARGMDMVAVGVWNGCLWLWFQNLMMVSMKAVVLYLFGLYGLGCG